MRDRDRFITIVPSDDSPDLRVTHLRGKRLSPLWSKAARGGVYWARVWLVGSGREPPALRNDPEADSASLPDLADSGIAFAAR
jgi:hypothetical protein